MAITKTSTKAPLSKIPKEYTYEYFATGKAFESKKQGRLPAMGWNSWNAFGSRNTEELTQIMADRLVSLGLKELGYEYVVLDDGCYRAERENGRLVNEDVKFPSGFKALADYVHSRGLKFGMYNDIGTNLCAGSAVGTCGFEDVDAQTYTEWDVDFLKVDNCYYLWDNATFSNPENMKYTHAPNIKGICVIKRNGLAVEEKLYFDASSDGILEGRGVQKQDGYVTGLFSFDGTNVGNTPIGVQSGELVFEVVVPGDGEYEIVVTYATGKENGVGQHLQVAVGDGLAAERYFDGLLPETQSPDSFIDSSPIKVILSKGTNRIRLMNHRRQENVLISYAALFNALREAAPDRDVLLSICEWGKTMPHNWGYKIGNSWRILNDITFAVGSPEEPGKGAWEDPGTPSITSQYDKAVIMDEYAGLSLGWNDPDMLVIGMDGVTETMARTHMAMWCMMNAPLMLGMDLRKVQKGDSVWSIIANRELIALNQDALGVQAKRIYCSVCEEHPDTEYVTNHNRMDVLAKPLANGDVALAFFNLSTADHTGKVSVSAERIVELIGNKMIDASSFVNAKEYKIVDLITGERRVSDTGVFAIDKLDGCGSAVFRITSQ